MQVFEAPEVVTQQKVSVSEEAVAASEHGKEPSGWFPPPEHTEEAHLGKSASHCPTQTLTPIYLSCLTLPVYLMSLGQ